MDKGMGNSVDSPARTPKAFNVNQTPMPKYFVLILVNAIIKIINK